MRLDFGAIGKGYAADAALAALADLGIRRALVAASGDLAIGDPPPGRRGWTVGIDGPGESTDGFTRRLELCNAAVSTSGAREQNLEAGGVKYSHIVDPATGTGLTQAMYGGRGGAPWNRCRCLVDRTQRSGSRSAACR